MAKKLESSCELCSSQARMFCDSDQARLCWDCDEKVHAANFLVAKHTRTALCNLCHCQTPWKASGPKLGRTISVCGVCVARSARTGGGSSGNGGVLAEEGAERSRNVRIAAERGGVYAQREELNDDDYDDDSEGENSGDEDEYSGGCDEDDDDDDENQVVPWTSSPSPPATSTSSSEEEGFSSHGSDSVSTIRIRDLTSLSHSNGEIGGRASSSSSTAARSRPVAAEDEEIGFLRPWKHRRVTAQP